MKKIIFFGLAFGLMGFANAQNKVLYGLTATGGANNNSGVMFSYDPAPETYTKKHDFSATWQEGRLPRSGMMLASNGKLYGHGYSSSGGVLFEYDPVIGDASYTVKKVFSASAGLPQGSIPIEVNGKLYSMYYYPAGAIFEYDLATGAYEVKHTFGQTDDGKQPYGSLTLFNGKLYGLTSAGGTSGRGTIFEFNPADNSYAVKYSFVTTLPDTTSDGRVPYGSLTVANGKLYGMTNSGGANNGGILFEYDPATATYTKKFDFDSDSGTSASGDLTLVNGKLYGVLPQGGGTGSTGVIFEYDPATNVYTKKISFTNPADGQIPIGALTLASNGKLYGLTSGNSESGIKGVLFEYDPVNNIYTKKLDLQGNDGLPSQYNRLVEIDLTTLATAESNKNNIQLYPNPVEDVLYLKGVSKANVSVYNTAGQQVLSSSVVNGQFNLSFLSKGFYLVKVETDGKVSSHKVVKK